MTTYRTSLFQTLSALRATASSRFAMTISRTGNDDFLMATALKWGFVPGGERGTASLTAGRIAPPFFVL
ncbi:MAG: hypothetical protein ACI4MS_01900 [Candidatus Coproplasma sp.]